MSSVQGHVMFPVAVCAKQTKVHSPANGLVQGHVIFPVAARAKQTNVHSPPANGLLRKYNISTGFWGVKGLSCGKTNVGNQLGLHNVKVVNCSLSSSFDGHGSMAENFNENDAEYVICSVINASEVRNTDDGFMIKLINGRLLRCALINPRAGKKTKLSLHPAVVLKTEDGTDLLLPVLTTEVESASTIIALEKVSRRTIYEDMMAMIDKMGYKAKLVRITKRVHDGFFSRLYLTKLEDETQNLTFDMRSADAINIAMRCKVPIQVNKNLAYRDGMRVMETLYHAALPKGVVREIDWRQKAKEEALLRNMLFALGQGRYADAVRWRKKILDYIEETYGTWIPPLDQGE